MCGVVGVVGSASREHVRKFIDAGSEQQKHRGPDAQGSYIHEFGNNLVGLSHQRLSILDLSAAGTQPMHSASGRYTIIFNGEIYNYVELVKQYGLRDLKSASDTEVALELFERLGPERALASFNGMWAVIILDRHDRKLYVSRDRFGKKPLYYLESNGVIYFASELKTFLCLKDRPLTVNAKVASRYLAQSLQNIDEDTWLTGVKAFPSGTWAYIDVDQPACGLQSVSRYWNYPAVGDVNVSTFGDFIAELRETVLDAVRIRLRSDVQLGLALSGGLDSSIISGATQQLLGAKASSVSCFSAVSPGSENDESQFIDSLAAFHNLRVNKVTLDVEKSDSLYDLLRQCSYTNDAPLASFSNALFYLLMQKAAQLNIKVIYSGQGADEAFCGYKKYPMFEIKRLLRSGRVFDAIHFASGFIRRGTVFSQFSFSEAKRYLGRDNTSILGEASRNAFVRESLASSAGGTSARQRLDIEKYSVPYLTHYEDRMSMALSREVRAPFLDYRVVEMGLRAPARFKMDKGWTKYCLRKAFEDVLPPDITWRKDKQGFVNPQDDWLRGPLRLYVEAMIGDANSPIFSNGLVDRVAYKKLFARYCNGDSSIWFRDVFAPFALNLWIGTFKQHGVT